MYALDALVGNDGRLPESILYDSAEGLVYTTDFRRAFGTKHGLPAYLQARAPSPGDELRRRLGALSEARLTVALGENVDRRQRRAILARRDALLALPAATATVQRQ